MAAAVFPARVPAAQVGAFFVGQYYHILQQQPSFVHQFYTEASTMLLIDGATTQTATTMMQIHSVIMTLNFAGIEIKTAHSLESWDGGVLVMVSGFVQAKDYNSRRKFVQTFFLAPQENGYFVLNDMFHLLEEEQIPQPQGAMLAQSDHGNTFVVPNPNPDPVSDYMLGEKIQARDYEAPIHAEENNIVDQYDITEQQQISEQNSESDGGEDEPYEEEHTDSFPVESNILDEPYEEEHTASFTDEPNIVQDPPSVSAEQPVVEPLKQTYEEPPKQTYASILRLTKGQSGYSTTQAPFPHLSPMNKTTPVASGWILEPQSPPQQSYPALSTGPEKISSEAVEESFVLEDEGEEKSVYVRNLPPSITESELEHEFKNFGRIKHDGVALRSRKDSGVYYAFVEFEDIIGVHNALKASPIQLSGRQIYIEERKPNSSISRGGRRGSRGGRVGGYQSGGRFGGGRSMGRGGGSNEKEYNNSWTRVNGSHHHRAPPPQRQQDRKGGGEGNNEVVRNGQDFSSSEVEWY